jgi:ABC-type transport system substrate-binding protein
MRLPKARAQSRPNFWFLLLSFWVAPIFGAGAPTAQGDVNTVVSGGSLIYLEAQAHINLDPPAGGFYPNGGILYQIADRLTSQNPKTLKMEPWVAESGSTHTCSFAATPD